MTSNERFGKYEVIRRLGLGGMAEVYEAQDPMLGRTVAIKTILPHLASEPGFGQRFLNEARLVSRLRHPHIVQLFDYDVIDDQPFMVMEYLAGDTLKKRIIERRNRGERFRFEEAVGLLQPVAAALDYAHERGTVHRDVKPANILFTSAGEPVVVDFGIARLLSESTHLSAAGAIVGTPAYMSPEQAKGDSVEARSDQYSLGIILYELTMGRVPFIRDSLSAMLVAHLTDPPPPPRRFNPNLPEAAETVLMRALTKKPQERFETCRAMLEHFTAALGGESGLEERARLAQEDALTVVDDTRYGMPEDGRDSETEHHGPHGHTSGLQAPVAQTADGVLAGSGINIRHNLPAQAIPFVGRELELTELGNILTDPDVSLLTIVGAGGMGKTRLAVELAALAVHSFPDGVFFVPLAPLNDPEDIVLAVAESMGYSFHSSRQPREQLLNYLSGKQALLLLDNFEHLLEASGFVAEIRATSAGVKLLVTSRVLLNLTGETSYALGELSYPRDVNVGARATPTGLSEYDAAALFLRHLKLTRPQVEPGAEDLHAIIRICQIVQGMPLAIVLAAGWLQVLSPSEIADEIAQSLDILESEGGDLAQRQRSIRAVFDYSWSQLAPDTQDAFMKLCVFRSGFDRQAARAVAGATLRTLRSLASHSLITMDRPGRYTIHEILRQLGEEQLVELGPVDAIRDAHSNYFLNRLARREEDLKGHDQIEALKRINADYRNIRQAFNRALARDHEVEIAGALESLFLFFNMRFRYPQEFDLFARTASHFAGDSSLRGRALARGCLLNAYHLLEHERLQADAQESLAIARQDESEEDEAFACFALGTLHLNAADPVNAIRYFQESLKRYDALGDLFYVARLKLNLGYVYSAIFDMENYLRYMGESLELSRQIGSVYDSVYAAIYLSNYRLVIGNYETGEELIREALIQAKELDDPTGLAVGSIRLALARLLQGDFAQARDLADLALKIARELEIFSVRTDAMTILGLHAALEGNNELALQICEQFDEPSLIPHPFILFQGSWAQATAYAGVGRIELAMQSLQQAIRLVLNYQAPAILTWLLPLAAILLARFGQMTRAVELVALIDQHPGSPTDFIDNWKTYAVLRETLLKKLEPERYRDAWQRGSLLDVTAVAVRLLNAPNES